MGLGGIIRVIILEIEDFWRSGIHLFAGIKEMVRDVVRSSLEYPESISRTSQHCVGMLAGRDQCWSHGRRSPGGGDARPLENQGDSHCPEAMGDLVCYRD